MRKGTKEKQGNSSIRKRMSLKENEKYLDQNEKTPPILQWQTCQFGPENPCYFRRKI